MNFDSIASGVIWLDAAADTTAVVQGLHEWEVAHHIVDADSTKASIIDAIATELEFPEWAGRNLDALYDLLTDLDWLERRGGDEPAGTPTNVAVVLERTAAAQAQGVDGWHGIVKVLTDAAAWWQPEPRTFLTILR